MERTPRGHPGVIRADIPAKTSVRALKILENKKTSISARTSMTRRRGRPQPSGISKNFSQKNFGLNFCSLVGSPPPSQHRLLAFAHDIWNPGGLLRRVIGSGRVRPRQGTEICKSEKQPKHKVFGRDIPGTSGTQTSGYPGQKLYASGLFLLFWTGSGRDIPRFGSGRPGF